MPARRKRTIAAREQAAGAPAEAALDDYLLAGGQALSLGRLAVGAAHEINNPLFAVLGLVEFLLADDVPAPRARERLRLVRDSGLEIKAVVGALLEFARARPEEVRRLPLEEAAARAVSLFRTASAARDVTIVERAPAAGTLVEASQNRLEQLFLALLENAEQALPQGGEVEIAIAARGSWVEATVTDSGPGFPAGVLERVFDPCFTTRADRGAAGLGLTLARAIARREGGELEAANAPARGARLTLRLPAVS